MSRAFLLRTIVHALCVGGVVAAAYISGLTGIVAATTSLLLLVLAARATHNLSGLRTAKLGYGDILLPLGLATAGGLVWSSAPHAFYAGAAILALADPLAALVGVRTKWGVWHIACERRTILGSIMFFAATIAVLVAYAGTLDLRVLASAAALTLLEAASLRGSDNLTLPVATVVLCLTLW